MLLVARVRIITWTVPGQAVTMTIELTLTCSPRGRPRLDNPSGTAVEGMLVPLKRAQ